MIERDNAAKSRGFVSGKGTLVGVGEIIADVVEGLPNSDALRFARRARGTLGAEPSRGGTDGGADGVAT